MKMTKKKVKKRVKMRNKLRWLCQRKLERGRMISQKAVTPAEKHKTENDASFLLFVGNLNSVKNVEELKKALNGFFTKKKLSVMDV
ncbi:hypothetical protein scyTo_0015077 [Scyliorhinus torazame]|uniref:RRM domain-containing protein n=1 Tax=Scyliorhinus torazame TaxID=75743 RepID=A0A401P1R1_SCYTO|nr:hypothetical protein [Scyliorhinus torazame]